MIMYNSYMMIWNKIKKRANKSNLLRIAIEFTVIREKLSLPLHSQWAASLDGFWCNKIMAHTSYVPLSLGNKCDFILSHHTITYILYQIKTEQESNLIPKHSKPSLTLNRNRYVVLGGQLVQQGRCSTRGRARAKVTTSATRARVTAYDHEQRCEHNW